MVRGRRVVTRGGVTRRGVSFVKRGGVGLLSLTKLAGAPLCLLCEVSHFLFLCCQRCPQLTDVPLPSRQNSKVTHQNIILSKYLFLDQSYFHSKLFLCS